MQKFLLEISSRNGNGYIRTYNVTEKKFVTSGGEENFYIKDGVMNEYWEDFFDRYSSDEKIGVLVLCVDQSSYELGRKLLNAINLQQKNYFKSGIIEWSFNEIKSYFSVSVIFKGVLFKEINITKKCFVFNGADTKEIFYQSIVDVSFDRIKDLKNSQGLSNKNPEKVKVVNPVKIKPEETTPRVTPNEPCVAAGVETGDTVDCDGEDMHVLLVEETSTHCDTTNYDV